MALSDILLSAWGAVLSLACEYFPGIAKAFEKLNATQKRLVQIGGIIVIALVLQGLVSLGIAQVPGMSAQPDWWALLEAILAALGFNQGTYWIARKR
jgi:DNA-binding transcriptional LysR family regulator